MKKILLMTAAFSLLALPAIAECVKGEKHNMHMDHSMHMGHVMGKPMQNMAQSKKTKADRALYDVSIKMHNAMDVALISTNDSDFVRAMIPHHQGAIDMAEVVLKYGKDPKVAKLARNIIKAQTAEIYWMKRWLQRADQPLSVQTGNGAMEKSANTPERRELLAIHHNMHQAMDVRLTGNADNDFTRAMIPHHQGAMHMSYWLIQNGRNPEVKDLARTIMKEQRGEISLMRGWLKDKEQ